MLNTLFGSKFAWLPMMSKLFVNNQFLNFDILNDVNNMNNQVCKHRVFNNLSVDSLDDFYLCFYI